MTGRTVVAIVNPTSAGGKTARVLPTIRSILPADVQFRHTEAPGHAIRLTSTALKDGADVIVAIGGDGTINEVVNGFFRTGLNHFSKAALGIIPCGTSSDLRRSLRIPANLKQAASVIQNGQPRMIDAMRVQYTDHDGRSAERFAINMVSFGMGGAVATRAKNTSKMLGGRVAFLTATVVTAFGFSGKPVTISLDRDKIVQARITNVAVGNGQFHGAGMWVCPNARLDDGLLDVTVISRLSLLQIVAKLPMLYNGDILRHPLVRADRAQHLAAESTELTLVEIDGEPVGRLPIKIDILPAAINILA